MAFCLILHSKIRDVRQPWGLTRTIFFVRGCFARCTRFQDIMKVKMQ